MYTLSHTHSCPLRSLACSPVRQAPQNIYLGGVFFSPFSHTPLFSLLTLAQRNEKRRAK